MKKLFAMMLSFATLLVAMTACSSHSHTEAENWVVDATGHWKLCGGCDEKLQAGDHTVNDGFTCDVCGSEILDFGDFIQVSTYDAYQNLIRMADYDTDGSLLTEMVNEYEYDANGNLTNDKQYIDGRFSSETEYSVADGMSIPAKYTYYSEDGSKFVNEYDSNGNVVQLIDYDANGNVNTQLNSQYAQSADGEWYESAVTETYSDGTMIKMEYDEVGSHTSRVIYDADSNVTSMEAWEYTYDNNGFTVTERLYIDEVLYQDINYKTVTEENGMFSYPETVTTYNEDGGKTVCVYDENHELVSETKYDADDNVIE